MRASDLEANSDVAALHTKYSAQSRTVYWAQFHFYLAYVAYVCIVYTQCLTCCSICITISFFTSFT